ncbi:MAG: hypothetical protein JST04_00855 [Bdellovibrionales bacterium]|nr:hypothetical protein [Bdellovibrionales bacterium]
MFKVIGKLTGTRPTGTDKAQLETTPTSGGMRLNTPAAATLGVSAGDHVMIVLAGDEGTEPVPYLAVGGNSGAKLAFVNAQEKKGKLSFSDAAGYAALKGNSSGSNVYDLGEAVESDGVKYYPLTLADTKTKAARKERTPEQIAATQAKKAANKAKKSGTTEAASQTTSQATAQHTSEEF